MRRQLLIEIDCGEYADDEHCGYCPKKTIRRGWDYCAEFDTTLAPAMAHLLGLAHRCDECKAAEVTGASIGLTLGDPPMIVQFDECEAPPNAEYIDIGTGKKVDSDEPAKWLRIRLDRKTP